jgi:phosphoglycolate phosphatase
VASKLFIFDLDGTLVDSVGDLAAAVNLTRAEFGLGPVSVQTVGGYVGDGIRVLMARALQDKPGADLDRAVRLQKEFYLAHLCDLTRPYPGVPEGLERLRTAGHALALATNKPTDVTETLLEKLGLRARFAAVYGGGSVPELKPHPAMLEAIMGRLGFGPGATWMVGDNRTDLEAARRAGVRSVLMSYGIGEPGPEKPDLVFETFADFTDYMMRGDSR